MVFITKSDSLELFCVNMVSITFLDFPTLFNSLTTVALWNNIFCLFPFSLSNFMLVYSVKSLVLNNVFDCSLVTS